MQRNLFRRTFAVAILGLAGLAAGNAQAQDLTLRFATIASEGFPYVDGIRKFKEAVEANSGGQVKVSVFIGGQLGNEREINEAILEGSIHLGIGAGSMAKLAPIYNLVQVPFLVQGQDHMEAIADGPIGTEIASRIKRQAGFRVLGWWSTGDSSLETVKAPVRHPDDLKGVKMRVNANPALVDGMKAMGAYPTPMAYGEVYTGLKQGVIEGAHLDVISVDTLKIYESIRYMTDWDQITFLSQPRPVIMKASYFDSLTDQQQGWIRDAMAEASTHERKVFRDKMDEIRGKLVDLGITITKVDTEAFLEKIRPVWDKYAEQLSAKDLLEQIIAAK
ncbi:MAG: TRAP transporter substrate-binding protein [Alphaproteobacteria bacterium]